MAEEKNPKTEEVYYELMPHKKIKQIKKEIESLKKKAETESFTSKSFMSSVSSLTNSIDSLMELFKEATEGMKFEEQAEEEVSKKIEPLLARMDDIEEQNRKIAQGIVVIADMVTEMKEKMEKKESEMPRIRPMPRPKIIMPPQPRPMPPKPPRGPPPLRPMPPPIPPPPGARPMPPPPWEKPGAPSPIPPGPPMPSLPEFKAEKKKKGLLGGLFKK